MLVYLGGVRTQIFYHLFKLFSRSEEPHQLTLMYTAAAPQLPMEIILMIKFTPSLLLSFLLFVVPASFPFSGGECCDMNNYYCCMLSVALCMFTYFLLSLSLTIPYFRITDY